LQPFLDRAGRGGAGDDSVVVGAGIADGGWFCTGCDISDEVFWKNKIKKVVNLTVMTRVKPFMCNM
jgi:hypothetical protein